MIKTIIFDLDGVLIDNKNIHFESFNEALGEKYFISWNEHISKYDGLKTKQKLELLSKEKKLPINLHDSIWEKKQKFTLEKLKNISENKDLIECIKRLSEQYKLIVCSNSVRKTVNLVLSKLNIIEYFDLILSNEDVNKSKPHPEIYNKALSITGNLPEETLIIEDSPCGLLAAKRSNCNVIRVNSSRELTYEFVIKKIDQLNLNKSFIIPKWEEPRLNIVIPMAGLGTRFKNAGFELPKPLIQINGTPMINLVTENLNINANFIYIVQKEHRTKYNLELILNLINKNCTIIEVDQVTEGAACTVLMSKNLINNNNPLLIANSDQYIEWNSNDFMYKMNESGCDAGIVTFKATNPKWSYVKLNDINNVIEVAEKKPISDIATAGIYFWKHGSDFVKFAEQMISKNIRTNNEFYVCPVFNEAVLSNKIIKIYECEKMWGLGTPEDLKCFLESDILKS